MDVETTALTVEVCADPVLMGHYEPIATGSGFILGCDWLQQKRLCLYEAVESGRTRLLWEGQTLPDQIQGKLTAAVTAVTAKELYLHSRDGLTYVYTHELQHCRDLPRHTGDLLAVLPDDSRAYLGKGVVKITDRESLRLPENCVDLYVSVATTECSQTRPLTAVTCLDPNTLAIYNAKGSLQFTKPLPFEPAPINAVAVLPGNRFLVACFEPPAVHIYSARGRPVDEWTSTQLELDTGHFLWSMTVSGKLMLLVTMDGDRICTLRRYTINDKEHNPNIANPVALPMTVETGAAAASVEHNPNIANPAALPMTVETGAAAASAKQHEINHAHGTDQMTRHVAMDTRHASPSSCSRPTTQPTVEVCAVAAPVAMGRDCPLAAGSGFVLGGDRRGRLCLYAATESGSTRLWGDRPQPAQIPRGSIITAAVTATEIYLHSRDDGLTYVYSHELQHRSDLPRHTGSLRAVLSDGSRAVLDLGRGEVTIAGRESITLPENCRDDCVSVAAECRETGRWTAVACRDPDTLILYDAQGSRQFTESLSFRPAWLNALAVLPGDRLLVAALHPPAVHIYSVSGGLTHEHEWTSTQLGLNARHWLYCLTVSGNRLLLVTESDDDDESTLHRYRITHTRLNGNVCEKCYRIKH